MAALITAGRSDIASGQSTVENLLNQIIGEQDTAAAAEAAAASALAAIASLTTQQEQATANIANAYSSSLTSIEVSYPYVCSAITQTAANTDSADRSPTIIGRRVSSFCNTCVPKMLHFLLSAILVQHQLQAKGHVSSLCC